MVKKLRTASEEIGRGKELGEVCRQLEVSEATYHRWKKQYAGPQSGLEIVSGNAA
ncbi:MAG: transposase [Akkermansiaceae bacterium]